MEVQRRCLCSASLLACCLRARALGLDGELLEVSDQNKI
jgi:hypothetical protein